MRSGSDLSASPPVILEESNDHRRYGVVGRKIRSAAAPAPMPSKSARKNSRRVGNLYPRGAIRDFRLTARLPIPFLCGVLQQFLRIQHVSRAAFTAKPRAGRLTRGKSRPPAWCRNRASLISTNWCALFPGRKALSLSLRRGLGDGGARGPAFLMRALIDENQPLSAANCAFRYFMNPSQAPNQSISYGPWPYTEGPDHGRSDP